MSPDNRAWTRVHRTTLGAALVLISTAGLVATGTGMADAAAAKADAASAAHHVASDFDGDGRADVAIGEPRGSASGGRVIVKLTSGGGATHTQLLTAPHGTPTDEFGAALAVGDFNGDGYADLAVGAPGYQDPEADGEGQGEVVIFNGSASGLVYASTIVGPSDIDNSSSFGNALAAADTNGDGRADLAVGNADLGSGDDPDGDVVLFLGSRSGLKTTSAWSWQAANDECGCGFGTSVAFGDLNGDGHIDLAIGAPLDGFTKAQHGGTVAIVDGKASGLVNTSVTKVLTSKAVHAVGSFGFIVTIGKVDAGARAELAVGAPAVTVDRKENAGKVVVYDGEKGGPAAAHHYSFTAATSGLPGAVHANSEFGATLSLADVNSDGRADLAIGEPGVSVSGFSSAGAVFLLRSASGKLVAAGSQEFTEATKGVPGSVRKGDSFGASLTTLNRTSKGAPELLIGAPEALGGAARSGTVTVLRGTSHGLTVHNVHVVDDATAPANAGFGTATS